MSSYNIFAWKSFTDSGSAEPESASMFDSIVSSHSMDSGISTQESGSNFSKETMASLKSSPTVHTFNLEIQINSESDQNAKSSVENGSSNGSMPETMPKLGLQSAWFAGASIDKGATSNDERSIPAKQDLHSDHFKSASKSSPVQSSHLDTLEVHLSPVMASETKPIERKQLESEQLSQESCSDLPTIVGTLKDVAKQDIALPSLASLSDQDIAPHASSEAESTSLPVPQNASSNIDINIA